MNHRDEFHQFCTNKLGISEAQFRAWEGLQNVLYGGASASLTPYILEEREMRFSQIDIFSRLMADRILWLAGPVDDRMSTVVQAQLIYLDNVSNEDITIHVDSPGGSVKSGLSIIDTIDLIKSPVATINTGMAASMGSLLLGCGTKGKREALESSRVMLHQVSHGAYGNIQDTKITFEQAEKYNNLLFEKLGKYCDKTAEQVKEDATRDLWLDAEQALEYGIIDSIVGREE